MTPSRAALKAILDRCRVSLNAEQLDRLWAYHGMLRAANAELNLTRIHNFENMVLKHYVDSLLVLGLEAELPSPLVDMGTGAGLPGIPLAIARPELRVILAEQRKNRAEFLESVRAKLDLTSVEVHAGRVGPRFPFPARGIITRAVAAIPETLDAVESVIEPGGRMLFMKGPDCDAEIAAFDASRRGTFRLVADHRYAIPGTSHARRFVVYERTDQPVASGPRPRHEGPSREVVSATNPTFQTARDLLSGRGVRKHGQALIAGKRIVSEVLEQAPDRVRAWLTDTDGAPPPRHPNLLWLRLAGPLFRELDVSGTHAPLLIVSVPEFPEWSAAGPWPAGCTLFVPFQDPENVGAVIRSAAAFGVPRVVLCREAAHPFHPKAVRAAGTALFQVNLERGPALADLDPNQSPFPLIALATEGADLAHEPWPERFGLVVGLEGPGLPETLRAGPSRRVPIEPNVESLNAAAATAIALYAWRSARGIAHDS